MVASDDSRSLGCMGKAAGLRALTVEGSIVASRIDLPNFQWGRERLPAEVRNMASNGLLSHTELSADRDVVA